MTCGLGPLNYIQGLSTSSVYTYRAFKTSWLHHMDLVRVEAINFSGLAPLQLFFTLFSKEHKTFRISNITL